MTQHVLYRMFDADGDLLYVGLTNNPKGRIGNHRGDKEWWPSVANITLEHFGTRQELEAAERQAILSENPRYNATYAIFSTAWCRAEGHTTPNGKRCEDCTELAFGLKFQREEEREDELLAKEFGNDPLICSFLGIGPDDQPRLTPDEMRAHPTWSAFEAIAADLLPPSLWST